MPFSFNPLIEKVTESTYRFKSVVKCYLYSKIEVLLCQVCYGMGLGFERVIKKGDILFL